MDKISVIVPVYNVEQYLVKCLNSIIHQTYKNIEIILVDDGSTDKSGIICDEFAKSNENIIVIHKDNGGLSDARNEGIKKANGNYICFIDGDDYIELDMIDNLYKSILENGSDIACCGKIIEKNGKRIIINSNEEFCINSIEAIGKMFIMDNIDNSACDKLFNKKLFDDICFPKGRYYEDIATIFYIFEKANKISHIKKAGYHYIIREGSISHSEFNDKQFDLIYFTKKITEEFGKKYLNINCNAESFYYLHLMDIILKLRHSSNFYYYKKEFNNLMNDFKINFRKLLKNPFITKKKKIMAIMIFLKLYTIVYIFKHNK